MVTGVRVPEERSTYDIHAGGSASSVKMVALTNAKGGTLLASMTLNDGGVHVWKCRYAAGPQGGVGIQITSEERIVLQYGGKDS